MEDEMRKHILAVGLMTVVSVNAKLINLEGLSSSQITTGNLIDGVRNVSITTNVVEIPGLQITARSGETNQTINALADSLGIDSDGSEDDSSHFEAGEKLVDITQRLVTLCREIVDEHVVDQVLRPLQQAIALR